MGVIKERRQQQFREQEAEKEENLKRKLAIIEKIKAMVTSPEEANKTFQEFKALQQEWRDIKAVPAEKANELWRNYQLYVEQFYDLLKLNSVYRADQITKDELNRIRFLKPLEHYGIHDIELADHLSEDYVYLSPRIVRLVPGTMELLDASSLNKSGSYFTPWLEP